ncbi:hypothetical protein EMCG_09536 [[Emmonsia] crescens]|uniref:Uncharacterized protein n=1 Tax=[Emmonsia] crescens TaxID=73230 RepID=A0A0G2J2W5_9EURO|nr:hypothetical protein EMCG_09536 [Emmonsia crescens UAMH 3008]
MTPTMTMDGPRAPLEFLCPSLKDQLLVRRPGVLMISSLPRWQQTFAWPRWPASEWDTLEIPGIQLSPFLAASQNWQSLRKPCRLGM